MRTHFDDRGSRYCDIFPEIGVGDINVTIVYPGTQAFWHRHQIQTDYQIVVKGALKIGVCNLPSKDFVTSVELKEWEETRNINDYSNSFPFFDTNKPVCFFTILSERNANEGPLMIPPGLWHGSYNFTNEEAILIYHITNKYDGTDEQRMTVKKAGWDIEREAK